MKPQLTNCTKFQFIGKDLLKAVMREAYSLEATDVIINKVRYNKWAEVELRYYNNCIARDYSISA